MNDRYASPPRQGRALRQDLLLAALALPLIWGASACIDDNETGTVDVRDCPGEAEFIDGECVLPRDIEVAPDSLGPATLGTAFVATLEASGGRAPYSFSATAEQLPPGLALSQSGELSGVPTQAGAFTFTVTATDAAQQSGQQEVRLTVEAPSGCEPVDEVCGDDLDNDCDGQIDEGCEPACVPEPEICDDGADNDCDGQIDEGCDPDCEPSDEVCGDDTDNDCDGVVDEGCEPACVPEPEVCGDGVDNDCDGDVDEELGAGDPCQSSNEAGTCGGVSVCLGGQWVCDAPEPSQEVCDGVDNDCDGSVDEGPQGGALRQDCSAPGCNSQGSQECVDGGWAPCAYPAEVCDGEDNNCNGSIDEDAPGQGEACGDGPGVCQAGQTVCRGGELVCEGVITGSAEVCDGIDNDCDGQIDEEDPQVGEACVVDRCGNGTWSCTNGSLLCQPPQVTRGQVDTTTVESSLIRAWTGTTQPYQDSNNNTSWSILLASDGERLYNVAYGIDGVSFAGWTVKVFVPEPQGLALQETFTIPVDWDATGAPRVGFGGLAADGERLWVLNGALGDIPGAVWTLDLEQRTAAPAFNWDGRDTVESSTEYDWTRDRFWTLQFNVDNAQVFQYPGSGIDPDQEQARFSLEVPVGDTALGAIAADGRHLYAMRYENQRGTEGSRLWQFGSGFGGTQPGDAPQTFARVRTAASITYHRDGFLYIPDQSNPAMVQRVAATAGGQAEICDGLDNDCDGDIDEGNLCAPVDLEAQSAQAAQSNFQSRAITLTYTVINRGAQEAPARRDAIRLASPSTPLDQRPLTVIERPALAAFSSATVTAQVELPEDLDTGEWLMIVEVDAEQSTGDTLRNNNQADTRFVYVSPEDCDPDRFEPNDGRGEARELGRVAYHRDLTLCSGEEDWYYIDVPRRSRQRVWIGFEHSDGDLTLEVYDQDGDLIDRGDSDNDDETVLFDNESRSERRYRFRVLRQDQGTNRVSYDLATGLL